VRLSNPLHPLFIGIVAGQDHGCIKGDHPRLGKSGGELISPRLRREWGSLFDQVLIKLEPHGLIKGHGSDQVPLFAIGGDTAGIIQ
jgi:hypothetical protein